MSATTTTTTSFRCKFFLSYFHGCFFLTVAVVHCLRARFRLFCSARVARTLNGSKYSFRVVKAAKQRTLRCLCSFRTLLHSTVVVVVISSTDNERIHRVHNVLYFCCAILLTFVSVRVCDSPLYCIPFTTGSLRLFVFVPSPFVS